MGKRFKFSPLKARALIIMLPTIGLAGIIFSQSVLIYIFRFEYFELILFNFDLPFDQLISIYRARHPRGRLAACGAGHGVWLLAPSKIGRASCRERV